MTPQVNNDRGEEHKDALALLEEMADCLRLAPETIRDLAQKVTSKSWEQMDMASAERVIDVLAEVLYRSLSRQKLVPPGTKPVPRRVWRRVCHCTCRPPIPIDGKEGAAWL